MRSSMRLTLAAVGLLTMASVALASEPGGPDRLVTLSTVIGISVKQSVVAAAKSGTAPWDLAGAESIASFYEQRDNQPMWVDDNGLTAQARQVIAELKRADDWGMQASDYTVNDPGARPSRTQLIETELAVTKAAVHYAHDAHVGRFDPSRISELIDLMSTPPDPAAVLSGLLQAQDPAAFLVSFQPKHRGFLLLRDKYLALRGGQSGSTTQVQVPDAGPRLKPGDTHPDIALLRQRLHVPMPPAGDPNFYDDALAVAVKDFQDTRGYRADGTVTPQLRRLLNRQLPVVAKGTQLEKVLANMERWRWLPENLGETYIQDNIPEFMVRVVKAGRILHSARIVVGKPDTPTPIFSKDMRTVEFHPFWKVPDSIKVNEILPSIARNGSGALARRGLRIARNGHEINPSTVDWGSTDIRSFDVYQPPGGGNALGDVKFLFPNRFSVYMHDTPSKELFADSVRAFSHGCMRVQNPQKLAEVVMGEANGWLPEQTKERFTTEGNQPVQLDHPIPVHVTYFTAFVSDTGDLVVIDDIYGHDRRTTLALAGKWSQVQKQLTPRINSDIVFADNSGVFGGSTFSSKKSSNSSSSGLFTDIFGLSGPMTSSKKKRYIRTYQGTSGYYGGFVGGGGSGALGAFASKR